MLDQSFSYENLKDIYDIEKRKGHPLDGWLDNADRIIEINQSIKGIYGEIKKINIKFKKELSEADKKKFNEDKDVLEESLTKAKERKRNLVEREIEQICDEINAGKTEVKIIKEKNFIDTDKPFYSIKNDLKSFLVKKHIQRQFFKLYKIKQANRYLVTEQIVRLLSNNTNTSAFNVIKVDIEKFYESINLERLEDRYIKEDNLLSPKIKNYVVDILDQYKKLSGSTRGVPRGIGFSAYLGELYMRDFDQAINYNDEIFFYARYVDDIIIVTSKESQFGMNDIQSNLDTLGLKLNLHKSFVLRDPSNTQCSFDYLGYSFNFKDKNLPCETLELDISEKRYERYKKKVDLAFDAYYQTKTYGRIASKFLFLRIKFLVSNLRLSGQKNNIVSGIYYSNHLIGHHSKRINDLDRHLQSKLSTIGSASLAASMGDLSFADGLKNEVDSFFFLKKNKVGKNNESRQLEKILNIWKHVK